jgi:hypothetical protein
LLLALSDMAFDLEHCHVLVVHLVSGFLGP